MKKRIYLLSIIVSLICFSLMACGKKPEQDISVSGNDKIEAAMGETSTAVNSGQTTSETKQDEKSLETTEQAQQESLKEDATSEETKAEDDINDTDYKQNDENKTGSVETDFSNNDKESISNSSDSSSAVEEKKQEADQHIDSVEQKEKVDTPADSIKFNDSSAEVNNSVSAPETNNGIIDFHSYYDEKYGNRYGSILLDENQKYTFNSTLTNVVNSAKAAGSQYYQEKYVHDWIINNTRYDYDGLVNNNIAGYSYYPEGVVLRNVAVCQGYALTFQICMDQLGINSLLVEGASNGYGHIWNEVQLDGEWYEVDTTWDDPVSSGDVLSYEYFNITDEQLLKDHTIMTSHYPAYGTKYNYYRMQDNFFTVDDLDSYYSYINKTIAAKKSECEATVYFPNGDAKTTYYKLVEKNRLEGEYSSFRVGLSYSEYYVTISYTFTY